MRAKFDAQEALDTQRSLSQEDPSLEQGASNYVGRPPLSRDPMAARLEEVAERVAALEWAVQDAQAEREQALRQTKRDLAYATNYAIADFATALLSFKDSLEAALRTETSDLAAFRMGLEIALKQLTAAFEKNGLIEICPLPGDPFDPHKHRLPMKGEIRQTRLLVHDTEQKGYQVAGRLIRPAVVRLMALD
jgi:molecular chaperone GrpE